MSELLPCPFCGGEARTASKDYGDTHYWRVFCDTPSCAMCMTSVFNSEASVIAAWNTRAVVDITSLLNEDKPPVTYMRERTCRNVDEEYPFFECSECGCHAVVGYGGSGTGLTNYCPNCGAKVVSE